MAHKYDKHSIEWRTYKKRLFEAKRCGASNTREVLQHIVKLMKPTLPFVMLGQDELKLAQEATPGVEQQVADDDGYTLNLNDADIQLLGTEEAKETLIRPVNRVNPIHHSDAPQTQEEIDAAWQRHKSFIGR